MGAISTLPLDLGVFFILRLTQIRNHHPYNIALCGPPSARQGDSTNKRNRKEAGVGKHRILSISRDFETDPGVAQTDDEFVAQSGHGCQYAAGGLLRAGLSLV